MPFVPSSVLARRQNWKRRLRLMKRSAPPTPPDHLLRASIHPNRSCTSCKMDFLASNINYVNVREYLTRLLMMGPPVFLELRSGRSIHVVTICIQVYKHIVNTKYKQCAERIFHTSLPAQKRLHLKVARKALNKNYSHEGLRDSCKKPMSYGRGQRDGHQRIASFKERKTMGWNSPCTGHKGFESKVLSMLDSCRVCTARRYNCFGTGLLAAKCFVER